MLSSSRFCNLFFRRGCSTWLSPPRAPPDSCDNVVSQLLQKRESDLLGKYPSGDKLGTSSHRQAWLESLATQEANNVSLLRLHSDIWGVAPRLDILADNVEWQKQYKFVKYDYQLDRNEMPNRNKRPWQLKGLGKARHRSIRSPIWIQGGKAHGNKGPRSYFYMISYAQRVNGLIHALTGKFAQDDVHIVDSLDLPTGDPEYLEGLIDTRGWNMSCLFVDKSDIFPESITEATTQIFHMNCCPVYGLNVRDMLHHKTLVLTLDALNEIEEKLLFALHRTDKAEREKRNFNCIGKDF